MDENLPRKMIAQPTLGEDLYGLSVHELQQRIEDYRSEIIRLEAELAKKTSERSAADALFKKSS